MDFSNLISRANNAFRNQDYKIAIELYQQYAQLSPEHQQRIAINLKLAEARLNKKTEYVGKNNKYAQITEEKIIVYTVNIGGYESVKEPTFIDSSVEYILFTDNKDLYPNIGRSFYLPTSLLIQDVLHAFPRYWRTNTYQNMT